MKQELYSVEQVAEILNLHVRTVRNYAREGRLKAVRIGKQYRIAAADLEAMTGRPAAALGREPVKRERHIDVSSIVEVDAISPDAVNRLTNTLMAIGNSRGATEEPLRIETIYDQERARLKIILIGGIQTNAEVLKLIDALVESKI